MHPLQLLNDDDGKSHFLFFGGSIVHMNSLPLLTLLAILSIGAFSSALRGADRATQAPPPPTPTSERGKVDINTADIPALEAIPEIGTNFANAVVSARPFKSVDDLDRILKIGADKMKELRLKVTASPVTPPSPPPARSTPDNLENGASKPNTVNEGKATNRKEVNERYESSPGGTAKEKSGQTK